MQSHQISPSRKTAEAIVTMRFNAVHLAAQRNQALNDSPRDTGVSPLHGRDSPRDAPAGNPGYPDR